MKLRIYGLIAAVLALAVLPAVATAPVQPTFGGQLTDDKGGLVSVSVRTGSVAITSNSYFGFGAVSGVSPDGKTVVATGYYYQWAPPPLVFIPQPGAAESVHIQDSTHAGFEIVGSTGVLASAKMQAKVGSAVTQ